MRIWRRARGEALVAAIWLATIAAAWAERVTIATYNLENYVAANRMTEDGYRQDYPKPEVEKAALRAVIRSVNADVIAFQEMGPWPYVKELQRDLARDGCDYPNVELLEADDADRHVAIFSRRPFKLVRKHTDLAFSYFKQPERVKRGLLEARIQVGTTELTVFAVHLKSRFTDRPDDPMSNIRRAGEAVAVRDRVLTLFPDPEVTPFVILGDFNDVPRSRPLAALSHRGKTIIAEPVHAEDSRGETWTHCYHKEESYSRIDYVLASPGLRDAVVDHRAKILDIPETLKASDHRPVVLTLELK